MKTLLITLVLITCTYLYGQSNDYVYSYDDMLLEEQLELINKHQDTLDTLIKCESNYNNQAINKNDGAKGEHSEGILQYKFKTFKEKALKYNVFPYAEEYELENFYRDPYSQKLITAIMLENEDRPLCHWEVCSRSIRDYKCR